IALHLGEHEASIRCRWWLHPSPVAVRACIRENKIIGNDPKPGGDGERAHFRPVAAVVGELNLSPAVEAKEFRAREWMPESCGKDCVHPSSDASGIRNFRVPIPLPSIPLPPSQNLG